MESPVVRRGDLLHRRPLSLLYVTLGFPILFSLPDGLAQNWTRGLPALLAVIALAAVASGWVLIVSFMYTGRSGLRRRSVVWWLISLAGACVVGVALVSAFLVPQSPPYSDMWNVRASLNLFIAGAPLLLPLGHLFLESHWAA